VGLLDRMSNGATPAPSIRQPEEVEDAEPLHEFALLRPDEEPDRTGDQTVRRFHIGGAKKDPFRPIRERVQTQLLRESNRNLRLDDREAVQAQIVTMLDEALADEGIQPARVDYMRILDSISNEVLGFGPIQSLLDDDTCTEIMVNGHDQVYVERFGKLQQTDVVFDDDSHVMRVIDKIVAPLGRRVDEASPMVDARLPDGSRVNAIIQPLSLVGPVLTIRRFPKQPLMVDDLVRLGSLTRDIADFLSAAVRARLNIIVSGGTGSGKTTLLNVLSSFIPDTDRIVTVEDAAELQLVQAHVITLEARPSNVDGKGAITIRELVKNCLRMRPDRIIVGEVRSGEALDMLQAMNTGHDGSLTTVHANTPRDTLSRIETMVLMAGMDLPVKAIRDQVSKAVDLIVQQERMKDGTRKITYITEVQGMEGDTIILEDIFKFDQTGYEGGKVIGQFRATGARPKSYEKFQQMGVNLPVNVFGKVLLNA
jgi:pilus assembly protein CpaF